jgi:hypothetical protein
MVWLPDEFLSTNEISSFEASMFNVGSSETELVEYIAEQAAKEVPFIEGIGSPVYECTRKAEPLNFSVFVFESNVYVRAKEVKDAIVKATQ